MAPSEQIRLIARTTMKTVLKLEGKLIGYRLIGMVRRFITRLTTPPTTKRTAARSTKPCFNGETPFIFLNLNGKDARTKVKGNSTW